MTSVEAILKPYLFLAELGQVKISKLVGNDLVRFRYPNGMLLDINFRQCIGLLSEEDNARSNHQLLPVTDSEKQLLNDFKLLF